MSNDFDRLGLIILLKNPSAVLLYVLMGVGPWGWPISMATMQMGSVCFPLWCTVPTSASAAEDMTFLKVTHSVRMGPLGFGVGIWLVFCNLSLK